jgi:DinB family protein
MAEMNDDERVRLLQLYEEGPKLLREALHSLPKELWTYKPAPDKWSIHEIVIHLADSEIQSHVRCRMILAEPGTVIPNHDEHQWSVALNYTDRDLETALAAIDLIRIINVELLRSVPASSWRNACIHSVRGPVTLEDWLATYVRHIPQHIEQIRRNQDAYSQREGIDSACEASKTETRSLRKGESTFPAVFSGAN